VHQAGAIHRGPSQPCRRDCQFLPRLAAQNVISITSPCRASLGERPGSEANARVTIVTASPLIRPLRFNQFSSPSSSNPYSVSRNGRSAAWLRCPVPAVAFYIVSWV
jgi:hypothetical protein